MANGANLQFHFDAEHTDGVALASDLTDERWNAGSPCEKWAVPETSPVLPKRGLHSERSLPIAAPIAASCGLAAGKLGTSGRQAVRVCAKLKRWALSALLPGRQPENVRKPRFGGGSAEARVDVETVASERHDAPAGIECSTQLNFADATWPPVARLTVAKAHEVKVTAGTQNGAQGRDVPREVGVVEDVEQTAVEDGVEGLAERVETQRVEHLQDDLGPTVGGLASGNLNRARGDIDSEGEGAAARGQDRVLTSPAARVEQGTR